MPEINGKPFVPPFCPAFCYLDEGRPHDINELDPSRFRIHQFDETSSGRPIVVDGEPVVEVAAAFSGSNDGEQMTFTAQVIGTNYPVDSEMSHLLQRVYDEPEEAAGRTEVERALGEEYCKRVQKCGGVLLRDGSPVCSALDPESFEPLLRKYYEGQA